MTEYDSILLASLESYFNKKELCVRFDHETAEKLISRSREQKVLPIVYLKNSSELQRALPEKDFLKIKKEVVLGVSLQLQRDAELVRICRILDENNLKYIVFKGAVCRVLYDSPEYRTSSDEDLLVGADNLAKAKTLLTENGYAVVDEKNGEVKLINLNLKTLVELHSSLTDESISDGMKEIGKMFCSQLENPYVIETGCGRIKTFNPTFGLLSLCVHFYNHFLIGGIGIRPVMDIACFIRFYSDEIDFDYCFSVLKTVNAEKLIKTVISLCVKYFGIESEHAGDEKTADKLLDDIIGAGAFGTSDSERNHSGSITKKMTYGEKGIVSTAVSVLFPSDEEIVSAHPELNGKSGEIKKYRLKRIFGFVRGSGKIKTITTSDRRRKLLKELGIAKSKH